MGFEDTKNKRQKKNIELFFVFVFKLRFWFLGFDFPHTHTQSTERISAPSKVQQLTFPKIRKKLFSQDLSCTVVMSIESFHDVEDNEEDVNDDSYDLDTLDN